MRRHLYLITDHPTEAYIGKVEAREKAYTNAEKNVETTIDKLNIDTGRRCEMSIVGLGYHDFADRDDYEELFKPVVDQKLREVDGEHLDKAGVEIEHAVVTDGGIDYEYRATGAAGGDWRRSEWVDKEQGLSDYERASEEWGAVAFERRAVGDDSTIQRKRKPSTEEWMDVTEDDLHFVDEEVKS